MTKRLLSVILILALACSLLMVPSMASAKTVSSDYKDYIRFIPRSMVVTNTAVKVTGYLLNIRDDKKAAYNFTDLYITIKYDGDEVISGYFNKYSGTVKAGQTKKVTLTYSGWNSLPNGTYDLTSHYYAHIECSYRTK